MKDGKSNGKRKTSEKEIDGSLVSGSGNNKNRKEAGRALGQHAGLTHPLAGIFNLLTTFVSK